MKAFSYLRFSTPEQAKGDSLRRQTDLRDDWLRRHPDAELDTSLRMTDLGVSAFKGKHRSDKAALGRFVAEVEAGRVPPGSYLLVENLDRLSREDVDDALELLLSLTRRGIKVVQLSPVEVVYQKPVEPMKLLMGIMEMSRGNSESLMKAERVGKAREKARELARTERRVLTARCPAWLRVVDGEFQVIPEAAKAIGELFRLRAEGVGTRTIAKRLNDCGHWTAPPRKGQKTTEWRASYVKKLLTYRALLGEYQPMTTRGGKRRPVGEPIAGYYPRVIDAGLFEQVRRTLDANKGKGGRLNKAKNLVRHMVVCGYCGGPMAFLDRGRPPKGGMVLACDRARRATASCKAPSIRYAEVEELVLTNCPKLRPEDVLPSKSEQQSKVKQLRQSVAASEAAIRDAEEQIDNLLDQIARTKESKLRDRYEAKMADLESAKAKATKAKDDVERQLRVAERDAKDFAAWQKGLEALRVAIAEPDGGETEEELNRRVELRERVNGHLRQLIDRIEVFPEGTPVAADWIEEALRESDPKAARSKESKDFIKWVRTLAESKRGRFLRLRFKNGAAVHLVPPGCIVATWNVERDERKRGLRGVSFQSVTPNVRELWQEFQALQDGKKTS